MKILIRIICIAAIFGVLGFSIMASATGNPNETAVSGDDRSEMIIAKTGAVVTSDNTPKGRNENTINLSTNVQSSAVILPQSLNNSGMPSFKFSEAGNMLLLGVALIMIAGLGRKVLHKN